MSSEKSVQIRAWGIIPLTTKQFIILEMIFFLFFLFLAVVLFSIEIPEYIENKLAHFHLKYTKYVSIGAAVVVIFETQFFMNRFFRAQLRLIREQKIQIEQQRDKITKQKQDLTDGIRYAGRIQNALLPTDENFSDLKDFFIIYKPKEIVSGDYYWVSKKDDRLIILVADCTGHGVPGAFMSVLGIAFLNEIIIKADVNISPAEILNLLRDKVIDSLHQTGKKDESRDGMDAALYILNTNTKELQFSGANNPLYIVRKLESEDNKDNTFDLIHIKPDSMPIGVHPHSKTFNNHEIKLKKGDTLYTFSDGYIDQFGGQHGKKFLSKNFKELLLKIQTENFVKQKEILEDEFEKWRNFPSKYGDSYDQVDDILIIGAKV